MPRTIKTAKPATAKPAKAAKPETTSTPAKPAAHIVRTAATIHRSQANFGGLSDRDTAYLGFYKRIAAKASGGIVTLSAIVADGGRPNYNGSNKPHDAGVIQRLAKAGLASIRDNGAAFTLTPKAASTKTV